MKLKKSRLGGNMSLVIYHTTNYQIAKLYYPKNEKIKKEAFKICYKKSINNVFRNLITCITIEI